MKLRILIVGAALLYFASLAFGEGEQKFASIGDLNLQSGAILKDCQVGYRTFGKLDSQQDNAVLVPTWYLGTSKDFVGSFHPGGLVDGTKYYVIAVDALTNGVSTSPSNSKSQRDSAFPQVSISDMVESQHRMLLGLGIKHLRAIMGISMGGIQTFQWILSYPDFMDKAIPIVGSPRPTSYDIMWGESGVRAIQEAIANLSARSALIKTFADYFFLALKTPVYYVQHVRREDSAEYLGGFEKALLAWDPYDMSAGLSTICKNNAFKPFGDSEADAAKAVKAKLLVISASQDHCINPAPALSFAKAIGAETLILTGDEGHSSPGAEMPRLSAALDRFLSQ